MTDQQIAKRVGDILTGKAMKYTHTIHFKSGKKLVVESDNYMQYEFDNVTRETLLRCGYVHESYFGCRWQDVESFETTKNTAA